MKQHGFGIVSNNQSCIIPEHSLQVIVFDFILSLSNMVSFTTLIGVYGMFNLYVFAVLVVFSPVISNADDMDELSSYLSLYFDVLD